MGSICLLFCFMSFVSFFLLILRVRIIWDDTCERSLCILKCGIWVVANISLCYPCIKTHSQGKDQLDSFMSRYKLLTGLMWLVLAISAFSRNYAALRIYWILWNFRFYLAFHRRIFLNRKPSLTLPRSHKVSIVLLIINWVSTSFSP